MSSYKVLSRFFLLIGDKLSLVLLLERQTILSKPPISSTLTVLFYLCQTIHNGLKAACLKAMVRKERPHLSIKLRQRRLNFSYKYKDWTVEDWTRVIWSDKTKINKIGSNGWIDVWKKRGEPVQDKQVQGKIKFGGGFLMVLECISWNGVGIFAEVEGRMNAE
jgi:hypothetical protein